MSNIRPHLMVKKYANRILLSAVPIFGTHLLRHQQCREHSHPSKALLDINGCDNSATISFLVCLQAASKNGYLQKLIAKRRCTK